MKSTLFQFVADNLFLRKDDNMKLYIEKTILDESKILSYKEKTKTEYWSIIITEYDTKNNKLQRIEFRIYDFEYDINLMNKSLILNCVDVKKHSKNCFEIREDKNTRNDDGKIFALISGMQEIVPDDVYTSSKSKDSVKVIRQIKCPNQEVDYGYFLSNIYIVEITLNNQECIHFFYERENANLLNNHITFAKPSWYDDTFIFTECKTYILIGKNNRDDYIPLSKLISSNI